MNSGLQSAQRERGRWTLRRLTEIDLSYTSLPGARSKSPREAVSSKPALCSARGNCSSKRCGARLM